MIRLRHRVLLAVACLGMAACGPGQTMPQVGESISLTAADAPADALWLDSLDVSRVLQAWGEPHAGQSVEGSPLKLKGVVYPHGIGTHAQSEFLVDLKGAATKFLAMVGVDDEKAGRGSVTFEVWVDTQKRADSGVLRGGDAPKALAVDLTGAKRLALRVTDAGDGMDSDHADWAGALLLLQPGASAKPTAAAVSVEPPRLVIPPPDPRPAIHGPRLTGATPGRPFLFRIPATGDGPLTYAAKGLPAGLTLDRNTGVLSGALAAEGQWSVELTVRGAKGVAKRTLTIVGGPHKLALTPPMGWNSWNVWAGEIDDARTRAAADAMIKSGLAAHGFQYVNIDDTWEAGRDASGEIQANKKFPDMKALTDYVHSQGLKIGIYSSPGPQTCGGYTGCYQHEAQDALTYGKWGFDYLKYDWCSYGRIAERENAPELEKLQKPYQVMRAGLDGADRDIVYSLCQYGMGDVWKWGGEVGGNCWRTTGDINDSWGSLYSIYSSQNGHEKFAGPGHWNDPDMLVVGRVGWGSPHPSKLTPNEQILHLTMWCLLSSPLLIGCDMTQMDAFTLALLSNDEALDVNQDPLGKPAGRRAQSGTGEVWARPLYDGTTAVGLINHGSEAVTVTVLWSDIGVKGRQPVRDLWLHRDVGSFEGQYAVEVPAHGAVMLKVGRPSK